MTRVMLATFGSLGDLHPTLAIGRALRARGVEVRVAAPADYAAAIEGAGLEAAAVPPSLAELGEPEALARQLFRPLRGTEMLVRDILVPRIRESHAAIAHAARDADLLVSHPLTFAVRMVALEQRKPWLSTALAPAGLISRHDPPVLPGLDLLRWGSRLGPRFYDLFAGALRSSLRRWERPLEQFRRELGLPPTDGPFLLEGQYSPFGTLALFDPVLASPQPDWPVDTTLCGTPLHDGASPDPLLTGELQRFLDRGDRPIVFALGSSAVHIARDFWPCAIDAATRLGRRAILLTGKPLALRLPAGVTSFEYLPYSQVFPHAAAVVHQVGIGTLSQALRSGRPQLLLPVAFDQPDNAFRAAKLGLARVLPFRRAGTARLTRELAALLDDPRAAAAASDVATRVRSVDGSDVAAGRILATLDAVSGA